jgi:predicted DNA-binding transcriptional regulator YafY
MGNSTNKKNWAARERLRMIEQTVWWRGWIKRKDLVDFFGISSAQASSDLQTYQELNPRALVYQMSQKRYEGTKKMKCVFGSPQLEEGIQMFLNAENVTQVISIAMNSSLVKSDSDAGTWAHVQTSLPARTTLSKIQRVCVMAVSQKMKIRVKYWSVHSGTAHWRWLAPHAFGHDGYRWHVRAWCFERNRYQDFVLGRIESSDWPVELDEALPVDHAWENMVSVKIRANKALDDVAQRAIEMDYGLDKGEVMTLQIREAMQNYLMAHLRLDRGSDSERPNHFEQVE